MGTIPAIISKSLLYCYLFTGLLLPKPNGTVARHPLHVSTTDMSFNSKDSQLEITCTIFTDDFESALSKVYHVKIDLTRPEMHTAMDALVKKYVLSHLQVSTAGPLTLNYLGFEKDNEAINIYVESNKTAPFKKIDADISLLHDLYDDQLNIVHITINGTRKSTKLEYPDRRVEQVF